MSQSLRNDTFGKPVQSVVSEASGNPWRKWPPHKDLAIAFEAFKLANQYLFGRPAASPLNGEDAPQYAGPVFDTSAIPMRHEPV